MKKVVPHKWWAALVILAGPLTVIVTGKTIVSLALVEIAHYTLDTPTPHVFLYLYYDVF